MQFSEIQSRALEIRKKYEEFEKNNAGTSWSTQETMEGLVTDVGDLMRLVMAKEGRRKVDGDVDAKLAHELSDCLWCIFVVANKYGVNLENAFLTTMNELDARLEK